MGNQLQLSNRTWRQWLCEQGENQTLWPSTQAANWNIAKDALSTKVALLIVPLSFGFCHFVPVDVPLSSKNYRLKSRLWRCSGLNPQGWRNIIFRTFGGVLSKCPYGQPNFPEAGRLNYQLSFIGTLGCHKAKFSQHAPP